jgi:hypothetical protein
MNTTNSIIINNNNNLSRKEKLLLYKQQKLNQNENINPSSNTIKNKQLLMKSKLCSSSNIINSIKKPLGINNNNINGKSSSSSSSSSSTLSLSKQSTNIHKSKVNILQHNNNNNKDISKNKYIQNDHKKCKNILNVNSSPNSNENIGEIRSVMGENGLDIGELSNPHILSFPIENNEIIGDNNNDKCCANINMLLGDNNDDDDNDNNNKDANIRVILNRNINKSRNRLKESIFKLTAAINNTKKLNNDKIDVVNDINLIVNIKDKVINKCENELKVSNVEFTKKFESKIEAEIIDQGNITEITNKNIEVKDNIILMEEDTKLITQHVPMPRRRGLKKSLVNFDQNIDEDNKLGNNCSDQLKKRKGTPYKASKFILSSNNSDSSSPTTEKKENDDDEEEYEEMDIDHTNSYESTVMTPTIRRSRKLSHIQTHS